MSGTGSLENSWDDTVLSERCRELGLTDEEVELVRDILGWNIRSNGKVPPLRYLDQEALRAFIVRLLGLRHFAKIKLDPVAVLRYDYRMPVLAIAWMVLSFKLNVPDREIQSEISSLRYMPPEIMWKTCVLPVFEALISPM